MNIMNGPCTIIDEETPIIDEETQEKRIQRLEEIFELLDQDDSGGIDAEELRILGKTLSSSVDLPTIEESLAQLQKADINQNNEIDLGEWLEFSTPLLKLSETKFYETVDHYKRSIQESLLPEGSRYHDLKQTYELLPISIAETQSAKSQTSKQKNRLSIKIIEDGESSSLDPFSPSGWFWGSCVQCQDPGKIKCEHCEKMFCQDHVVDHLMQHAQNEHGPAPVHAKPDVVPQLDFKSIHRVDSRAGFFPEKLSDKDIEHVATMHQQMLADEHGPMMLKLQPKTVQPSRRPRRPSVPNAVKPEMLVDDADDGITEGLVVVGRRSRSQSCVIS